MHYSEYFLGYPYLRMRHLLNRTEFSSAAEHLEYQQKNLAKLLDFAVRRIPFYRERLGGLAGKISPRNALESLQQFPPVTKQDIRANFRSLRVNAWLRGMTAKTGGSSGDTLTFVTDRFLTRQREKAFIWNQWARVGYRPGDSIAVFTGRVPKARKLYDHGLLFNHFIFSSFDITDEGIKSIVSSLNAIRPTFLHGYPSTIFQIARLMKRYDLRFSFSPKAILCGSERLFGYQRELIEDFYGSIVYSWYGHSEYAALGGECEVSHSYHMFPQYGYLELVPLGSTDEAGNYLYEIVATGFNNRIMPFIRYKTADYATRAEGLCSCGRQYPLIKTIVGRSQEFLVGKEDALFSVTVLTSQFEKLPFIEEFLFTQRQPGEAILSIVPSNDPPENTLNHISSTIQQLTRGKLNLSVELVEALPKTALGKRVYVDQRLNLSKYLDGGSGLHELQHVSSTNDQATRSVTMIQTIQKDFPSRALKLEGKFHWLNRYLFDLKVAVFKGIVYLPNRVNFWVMFLNRQPFKVFGRQYMQYRRFLSAHYDGYDGQEQLLTAVNKAIEQFPYYRGIYGKKRITSLREFENEIGFIDKNTILQQFTDFIHPAVNRRDYDFGTTGGTSGRPLQLIAHKSRYVVETATMHSLWERAGYRFDVRAVIRNHKLERNTDYLVNPITREVIFDGFRLNPDYFEKIYSILQKYKIAFIHCYPSHAYEFALFLLHRKLDVSFIKAFLSGSENIFEYQTDLIQNRLGIRFYNWYGHSEKLVLAGYCDKTNDYHIEPTYGYFELIDEKNEVIRTPGAFGEIVGTSFHNPGMFFLRYRTGDYAEYVGDRCSACGRRVPIIRNIQGRWSGKKLFNEDGTYVTTTALNLHTDLQTVINGLQYVQERKGEVTLRIVKSPEYRPEHERALYRHFKERFAPATVVKIEYADRMLRHPNGKFVQVISALNNPDFPIDQFFAGPRAAKPK